MILSSWSFTSNQICDLLNILNAVSWEISSLGVWGYESSEEADPSSLFCSGIWLLLTPGLGAGSRKPVGFGVERDGPSFMCFLWQRMERELTFKMGEGEEAMGEGEEVTKSLRFTPPWNQAWTATP